MTEHESSTGDIKDSILSKVIDVVLSDVVKPSFIVIIVIIVISVISVISVIIVILQQHSFATLQTLAFAPVHGPTGQISVVRLES